ncbi:MAG: hypothetical protein ACRDG7_11010 [Candidatus Limnocylindria bacterium]
MRRVLGPLAVAIAISLISSPVAAAKPEIIVEDVDVTFLDPFLSAECGFDVSVTLAGHLKTRIWTDAEGVLDREGITLNLHGTFSAGGATLSFVDAGTDMVVPLKGGGIRVEARGNFGLVTAPGHGPISGSSGQFVFTITPVLDDAGNPVLDEEGNPVTVFEVVAESGVLAEDLDAFCSVLDPVE